MAVRPRAIIFYGGFAFRGGGACKHASVLREELQRAGWSVELNTLESLPQAVRYLPHVVGKIMNRINPPMGFYYKDRMTRFLYRRFLDRDAQLKIFEDVYLSWNSETPSVTVLHAVWSDNLHSINVAKKGVERLVKAEERVIDAINHPALTVSEAYRHSLLASHGGCGRLRDIAVVPLGLDLSEFNAGGERQHAQNSLVFCGSLESRKNTGLLLRVIRELHEAGGGYRLTIIGDGPDRAVLEHYALEHLLPVEFCGRLGRADVIRELGRHSLYVHASMKESFSFALLEAKLAGLKTIAFKGLEVPAEFIDVPVASFDQADWIAAILSAETTPAKKLEPSTYSSQVMMQETLALAFGDIPPDSATTVTLDCRSASFSSESNLN